MHKNVQCKMNLACGQRLTKDPHVGCNLHQKPQVLLT